ncbi:unnamed protein product [Allacma fusca]|uniref:Uncharacterized protein n=1 Tax=Allacma fusca TaxID=39272 RepID=A0A8J2P702_9HEXA|nr:unnamed protein product [Allacma fusca]
MAVFIVPAKLTVTCCTYYVNFTIYNPLCIPPVVIIFGNQRNKYGFIYPGIRTSQVVFWEDRGTGRSSLELLYLRHPVSWIPNR